MNRMVVLIQLVPVDLKLVLLISTKFQDNGLLEKHLNYQWICLIPIKQFSFAKQEDNKSEDFVEGPIPKNKFIAHYYCISIRLILCSFDNKLDWGRCEIIQISDIMFKILIFMATSNKKIEVIHDTFNSDVDPRTYAIWDEISTFWNDIHLCN